jgi:hypothetical protein
MRRIILTMLSLTLFTGVAAADRWRRGRAQDTHWSSGGTVVRDSRHAGRDRVRVHDRRGHDRRGYDRSYDRPRHHHVRRPIYALNGRFVFDGGVTRVYSRPVIHHRYRDYRYRPALVVEHCDPVPGYVWVQGSWSWNGYEWTWSAGYYAPDQSWEEPYYDSY